MVDSGNTTAFNITIPGSNVHRDIRLDIREKLTYISPVVLMHGKGGLYDGLMSEGSEKVTIRSQGVSSPIFRWTEFDPTKVRKGTLVTFGGVNTTATAMEVNDGSIVKAKDILYFFDTKESVRVTAVSGADLTVTRAYGAKVADSGNYPAGLTADSGTTIAENAPFLNLGPAMEQGSTNRDTTFNSVTLREGATQILRGDVSITRTALAQEKTSQSKAVLYAERQKQVALDMIIAMEYQFFFGKLNRSSSGRINTASSAITVEDNGSPVTTTDGIFNVIRQYASANEISSTALTGAGNDLSVDKLEEIAFKLSQRPGNKVLFCGNKVKRRVQKLAQATGQLNQTFEGASGKFGKRIKGYVAAFGDLMFNYHPLFDEDDTLEATILAVNMDAIKLVHLEGGQLQFVPNAQANNYDGKAGYFIGEHGFCIAHAKEHFIFKDFTSLGV